MTALLAAPLLSLQLPPVLAAIGVALVGIGAACVVVAVVWKVREKKEGK